LIHRYSQEIENKIENCKCQQQRDPEDIDKLKSRLESLERLLKRHEDARATDYSFLVKRIS